MRRGWKLIGWSIGAISLYIFFTYFFDFVETKRLLAEARIFPVFLCLLSFLTAIVLRSVKWTFILKIKNRVRWRDGYHTVMISNLINYFFPIRLGEVAKLYLINRAADISYSSSVSAVLLDRFSQLFMTLAFLIFIPLTGFKLFHSSLNMTTIIFIVIFILLLLSLFFYGTSLLFILQRIGKKVLVFCGVDEERIDAIFRGRIARFFEETMGKIDLYGYAKRDLFVILFFSWVIIWLDGACYYFLLHAFGISISQLETALGACLMNLMFILPTPPGQVGTAEMYPVIIFSWGFGISSVKISLTAVLWHLLSTAVFLVLGICSLSFLDMRLGALFQNIRKKEIDS